MSELIGETIAFTLKNFTVTFFAVGVVVALVVIAVTRPGRHGVFETLLNWFLFFAIGITYIFNGIMHTVFGDMAAASIGWENNGFQAEVGYASIGIGVVGIMGFFRRAPLSLKLAALVGPTCFLWGAASAHIIDIVETGNMAPNNAGVILYTDILIPVVGIVLWTLTATTRPRPLPSAASGASAPQDAYAA